ETSDGRHKLLYHGTTLHGAERIKTADGQPETGRPEPLTYYYFGGAIHQAVDAARQAQGGKLGKVAAIGAGTGSLACHIARGEDWTFYEIDAAVTRIARDPAQFRFLSVCAPGIPVINGDARLTLAHVQDASLDLIIVDAFSSDAIPVHLLTSEAIALYQSKLTPHGVVALHISNRNMELGSVVSQTAALHGFSTWIKDGGHGQTQELASAMKIAPHVAVIARSEKDVGPLPTVDGWKAAPATGKVKPWTDDYADIPGAIWRKLVK
ncbi:MAG: spermidine synthase, partial [Bosea sp. (in: a-proteobacteria)]